MAVICCICGAEYDPRDPAVGYRSLDRKWWCQDETACTDRAARADIAADLARDGATLAGMFRALDQVWERLEKDGWQWPEP